MPTPSTEPPLEQEYAGQRLGLPEHGPGSVASWGRRIAALALDWLASSLVAAWLFGYTLVRDADTPASWVDSSPLLVFLVEATLLTALLGGSFGQLVLRVAVTRMDGHRLALLPALVRTLLICLVIPPLVFNRDYRGLHDLAAGTITRNR